MPHTEFEAQYAEAKPTILETSAEIVRRKGYTDIPVPERLYRSTNKESVGTVDSSTSDSMSPEESASCVREFLDRQEHYKEARERRHAILRKWEACPFAPKIDPNSERLACNRRHISDKSMPVRASSEPEILPSHIPTIDAYSDVLAAAHSSTLPVHERLYQMQKKPSSGPPMKSLPSPPTKPRTTPKRSSYSHITSRYDMNRPESVLQVVARREMLREQRRQDREQELLSREMEECTFQPNVSQKRKPSYSQENRVSGLKHFLAHQKFARQKSQERKKLDESYVSLRSSACTPSNRIHEITVPTPFRFFN
jgi:hypothetical protein